SRVLTRSDQDARPTGWKLPQVRLGGLVGAVLAPHHRKDAQLQEVRLSAESRSNPFVLLGFEAVFGDDLRSNHQAPPPIRDSKNHRPSEHPSTGSAARSGCGIRPRTFPARLMMPAMSFTEPLGLSR